MLGLWIFIGVFSTYVVSSIVLWRFPTLIHKKKKQKFKCRHISHRGGKCLTLNFELYNNKATSSIPLFNTVLCISLFYFSDFFLFHMIITLFIM